MERGLYTRTKQKAFNLSILDCKSLKTILRSLSSTPFNLSILDCKCNSSVHGAAQAPLLIYPYWIVNNNIGAPIISIADLLIYPYWIVNAFLRATLVL